MEEVMGELDPHHQNQREPMCWRELMCRIVEVEFKTTLAEAKATNVETKKTKLRPRRPSWSEEQKPRLRPKEASWSEGAKGEATNVEAKETKPAKKTKLKWRTKVGATNVEAEETKLRLRRLSWSERLRSRWLMSRSRRPSLKTQC